MHVVKSVLFLLRILVLWLTNLQQILKYGKCRRRYWRWWYTLPCAVLYRSSLLQFDIWWWAYTNF